MTSTETLYQKFLAAKKASTDTRKIEAGDIFFALKGPNFNGNEYAKDALKKGAAYVVIDEPEYQIDARCLLVEDSLKALQDLSRYHRDQLEIPFIAIAGSNGKTTTKELIKAVLSTRYKTYATPGNFNNEIGVPLTLLEITRDTEMAIIEMGAKHPGDIKVLCDIANPTLGIVTNTGKDHLETFKTLENTRKTNAELYHHLAGNQGTAFINIKYRDLLQEAGEAGLEGVFTYGEDSEAALSGSIETLFPYLKVSYKFQGQENTVQTQLVGKYNLENILVAIAIAKRFDIEDPLIQQAIAGYAPTNNRSQILQKGTNTFILDAYNANPSSMLGALENLEALQKERKVAILGDMLELGEASREEHRLIVEKLKTMLLDQVILVGPEFGKVKNELECLHFNDITAAREWFKTQAFNNTTILLKGSRGIALEKILED